jgi:hypothetical protein
LGYRSYHRSDEAITPTGDIYDVTGAVAPLSERFAKAMHMDTEVGLFHKDIWPDSRDQFLAGDDFSSPLDQHDQDIELAAAQLNRLVHSCKQPFSRNETKWTE